MPTLLKNISSLITVNSAGKGFKTGAEMNDIGEIKNGAILFKEKIEWVGTTDEAEELFKNGELKANTILDGTGKTVMPGFVDSHTHIVFAGSRADEFARRLRGESYQTIAAEGGGILKTMRAVRESGVEQLAETGRKLAHSAMRMGTTTMEIKSGYGLTLESELNQLRAAKLLQSELPLKIVTTFLGAHDIPPEFRENREQYIDLVCNEMIPAVAEEGLAEYCDAFTDTGYFTLEETERIFTTALKHGLKLRIHADELSNVEAAALGAKLGAKSADHLLFISDSGIEALKSSGTVATLLPGTAYTLKLPYAPARKIIDAGVKTALATDCNPGSCFCENMQLILSLACTNMKMSVEEAITAATLNGAEALGLSQQTGSLEVAKSADIIMLDTPDYANLVYHFGTNHVENVWIGGQRLAF
ncbi:MAG TPA: imidazolonepropionase [Patescibacteria group bacterium]|nr:imidazolonepropionase [Patescibacteria group bacterium]